MAVKKIYAKYNIIDSSHYLEAIDSKKEYILNLIVQDNQYLQMLSAQEIIKEDFDRILQDINVNYKYSRKLYNVLKQPELKIVNDYSFELLSNTAKPYLKTQEKTRHLILR
jgi:hypothetical protein